MRILRVHNRYQQPGGEDAAFEAESSLLEAQGHRVDRLEFTNDDIVGLDSPTERLRLAARTVWSRSARKRILEAIRQVHPDVVHFDNTLPLVSPAAYRTVFSTSAAVVQTLHNYRMVCPAGTLFRSGRVCEDCIEKTPPYPGVVHGCYRDSRAQTAVVAAMLTTHRLLGTYSQYVDRYIVLTQFAKQKLIDGGLPKAKTIVKPNFVTSPAYEHESRGSHMLFVGRLSPEKGVGTILAAQTGQGQDLRVIGDGPLADEVTRAAGHGQRVVNLGRLGKDAVRSEMLSARALIFPSECYETFGLVAIEAYAAGLPVIASRHGSMAEIVKDGVTGLHFEPGSATDLAAKIRWAAHHEDDMCRMGENARREYEEKYTPERNYEMLMDIYQEAIDHARRRTA